MRKITYEMEELLFGSLDLLLLNMLALYKVEKYIRVALELLKFELVIRDNLYI